MNVDPQAYFETEAVRGAREYRSAVFFANYDQYLSTDGSTPALFWVLPNYIEGVCLAEGSDPFGAAPERNHQVLFRKQPPGTVPVAPSDDAFTERVLPDPGRIVVEVPVPPLPDGDDVREARGGHQPGRNRSLRGPSVERFASQLRRSYV